MENKKVTDKIKKEIRKEVKSEIQSRLVLFLLTTILSVINFFIWKGLNNASEPIGLFANVGFAIIAIIAIGLSALNLAMWVMLFTEGGVD